MTSTGADPGRPRRRVVTILITGLLLVAALAGCGRGAATDPGVATGTAVGSGLAPAAPTTGLRTMPVSALPPEGITTLRLIASGGPFPYSKDGATFSNREGVLPREPSGFYREYTVVTPGSPDRGARRIIGGADGSRFYTADHYATFREVISS